MRNDHKFNRVMCPVTRGQVRQLSQCDGQLYIVRAGDTLFNLSRRFGVTVEAILARNPQIINPDIIYIGQVICIPPVAPQCDLRVLTLRFLTEAGQPLPVVNGAVQLDARVIVRATFNRPVSRAFFFIEPTGTEVCEFARLIGIDCPSAVTGVAEIFWQVPVGTLGRVYVVACINNCCAKSDEVLVVRNS
ncbi:MAG: LysM peptidoglycan-binding domain-containing protein [Bacillota bacterium]